MNNKTQRGIYPPPDLRSFSIVLQRLILVLAVVFSVSALSAYNLYVNADANLQNADGSLLHPYPSIQQAIDHAFDDSLVINQTDQIVEIILANSEQAYREELTIVYYTPYQNMHYVQDITIKSQSNNPALCKIRIPSDALSGINVSGSTQSKLKIQGIEFEMQPYNDNYNAIMIDQVPGMPAGNTFALNKLHIDNCVFNNFPETINVVSLNYLNNLIVENSVFGDVGEVQTNKCFTLFPNYMSDYANVSNNVFTVDRVVNMDPEFNAFVSLGRFYSIEFNGNQFTNATVSIFSSDSVELRHNRFENTPIHIGGEIAIDCAYNTFILETDTSYGALKIAKDTSEDVSIAYNQFYNCKLAIDFDLYEGEWLYRLYNNHIFKNSFIDCEKILNVRLGWIPSEYPPISTFRDNLYYGEHNDLFSITDEFGTSYVLTGDSRIPVSHCHFSRQLVNAASLNINANTISYGDAHIVVDPQHYTYELLWDYTVKSPCINRGCPEIDGIVQTDPDGTRPDIGALYYPHHHRDYFYTDSPLQQTLYWKSFPVIDDRSHTNGHYWNEVGMFFSQYMQVPNHRLESVAWSYDNNSGSMIFDNQTWMNTGYRITQPQGFKVLFRNSGQGLIPPLWVDGFTADIDETPIQLAQTDANGRVFPNWIGYFVDHTQAAGFSFSRQIPGTNFNYLDYIYSIKAQTWNTTRSGGIAGGNWIIDPNRYTLSEGDMVEIKLMPGAPQEMYWLRMGASENRRDRAIPEGFAYTELLDYTPIFIEFDPENTPDEVGVFVGNKCYGAAIVDDNIIEVNLYYQPEDAKSDDEISFMFYYADKSVKKAPAPLVYNPDTLLFESGTLNAKQIKDFGYVSYLKGEGGTMAPLLTQLNTNYPNPFRDKTNISYILEKEANISVEIYNLKGQKVKTLYSGMGKKGKHGLSWDSTDSHGKKVASGVYFCRLITPDSIQSQKMLLMK